jgi:uncharacterized small protein (DUF1192 family)
VLQKAEKAYQNAFVRQVASWYPERPEMRYMSFQTAENLAYIKNHQGRALSVEELQQKIDLGRTEIQRLHVEVARADHQKSRLNRAEGYLKNYEEYDALVEKMESNPFLKGKMLVSKSVREEYEQAVFNRDYYQNQLKKEGITGHGDFKKQTDLFATIQTKVPYFQEQAQRLEGALALLEGVLKGIQQAMREMQREQDRQQQRVKGKGKKRKYAWEEEMGR